MNTRVRDHVITAYMAGQGYHSILCGRNCEEAGTDIQHDASSNNDIVQIGADESNYSVFGKNKQHA